MLRWLARALGALGVLLFILNSVYNSTQPPPRATRRLSKVQRARARNLQLNGVAQKADGAAVPQQLATVPATTTVQPTAVSTTLQQSLPVQAAPVHATSSLPPSQKLAGGRSTQLSCTNMAGPWYRRDAARYKPFDAVELETPFESEVHPRPAALAHFPLTAVALAPGSRWADAAHTNLRYLMSIEVDRLLFSWRQLARRAQPRGVVGYSSGWEHPGSELRGHFLGHWLSAAAFTWAASGSGALRDRMAAVVTELEACSNALSGYLSAFPASHLDRFERAQPVWAPYYSIHKVGWCILSHLPSHPS